MSLAVEIPNTMLHIVHHALSDSPALADCLSAITPNSAVLLIQNAVYEAPAIAAFTPQNKPQFYVLKADLLARGVAIENLPEAVQVIDYEGFVDLVEHHNPVQSWF